MRTGTTNQVGGCSIEAKGKQKSLSFAEEVLLYVALSYLGWCVIYFIGLVKGWWS